MKKAIIAAVICALLVILGYQGYNWHKENFSKISKDLKTMKVEDFKEKVKIAFPIAFMSSLMTLTIYLLIQYFS